MSFTWLFPATTWLWRCVSSRWARRIYLTILLLLLATTVALRTYTFVLTQRAQAVLAGLAQLRIDETTEEELLGLVPYLARRGRQDIPIGLSVQRIYYAVITNEPGVLALARFGSGEYPERWWGVTLAEWLGYRYFHFDAQVIVLDGKVSRVRYGISKEAVRPLEASYIVSAKSFHGLWGLHQTGFAVTSAEDESPQYRVHGSEESLRVFFAYDAPREVTARAFQVKLSCFWGLLGCRSPQQLAPGLWKDKEQIEAKALARLQSHKPCPDGILPGRARYLTDVNILLLEVTKTWQVQTNEEGRRVDETYADFKILKIVRGYPRKTWETMRYRNSIPFPGNPNRSISNFGMRWSPVGSRVLMFANHYFESCTVVPATESALVAVGEAVPAPKRSEDQRLHRLL